MCPMTQSVDGDHIHTAALQPLAVHNYESYSRKLKVVYGIQLAPAYTEDGVRLYVYPCIHAHVQK